MNHTALYIDAPTPELLRSLTPRDAHERYCAAGWIEQVSEDGYTAMLKCPYCATRAAETELRLAVEASGIGSRYLDTTWADLDLPDPLPALKAASERITEIITSGHNALLAGPPGTGKTQAATLLLKAAIAEGHTARLANIGHTAMTVRAGYDDHAAGDSEAAVVERLARPSLLVIDDIGAGEAGEGKLELRILYFVLEQRQNARRATLLTSNLTPQQVTAFLGTRITNRLMPLETFVFNHGRNFRTPKGTNAWRPTTPEATR